MFSLRITGESVQYLSTKKNLEVSHESELLSDIEKCEKEEDRADNPNRINKKLHECLEIKQKKMKRPYVRSRVQRLQDGGIPIKYFCLHIKTATIRLTDVLTVGQHWNAS